MKLGRIALELDATDRAILDLLQENCKQPLAAIGEKVGLSAPAVLERIHKLEEAGVIQAYTALLDARRLGLDVTAFIGVSTDRPVAVRGIEVAVMAMDEVLECHHVTGAHTLMLKVKTQNTESLEDLIDRVRSLEGVSRTETMIVLSTHMERARIAMPPEEVAVERPRRTGARSRRGGAGGDEA
ncbi:MAG TPA: Lrp/AsnC family transcriptional regulator [Myxococcota bacterium]|nr:Lrp/AsnC family transcriptional regulator [Myxococcota bacterium]